MRHRAALLSTLLTVAAATLALPGRAAAVEPGFEVTVTEAPASITTGDRARTLTVVASSEQNRCQKVRWSLLLQVDGVELDEVGLRRIEEDGNFPVEVESDDDTARITDRQLDPGELCRGSTVTANYTIAVDDEAESGRITYQAQAFNAAGTLLQETTATSQVVGEAPERDADESPSPEPSETEPSDEPSEEPAEDEETVEPEETGAPDDDVAAVPASENGTPSLLGPGLVVGGLLVFVGVGLLLRLRTRARDAEQTRLQTGFYPTR